MIAQQKTITVTKYLSTTLRSDSRLPENDPMKRLRFMMLGCGLLAAMLTADVTHAQDKPSGPPPGFVSIFNGADLSGWIVPEGDNGHWKVVNGVIDYDAASEATGSDKNLWTKEEYGDFVLMLDWRIKHTTGTYPIPIVLPDGSHLKDAAGKDIVLELPNADSGVYVRGSSKAQLNIWCWPVGSGEVYGYRMDQKQPPEVRAGVTPRINADKPVGEWNTFIITMVGDRLTVILNNQTVLANAQLPSVPPTGKLALQHHGGRAKDGSLLRASSVMQFRNIYIRKL